MKKRCSRPGSFALLIVLSVSGLSASLFATAADTFVRGDLNGDGAVTVADCLALYMFVQQDRSSLRPRPSCMDAADVDDNGVVEMEDYRFLTEALFHQLWQTPVTIPAPHPEPGVDPTSDELDCAGSGASGTVDDPIARMEILDMTVAGGEHSTGAIKVRISHSRLVAGYSGILSAVDPEGESVFYYPVRGSIVDGTYPKRDTDPIGIDVFEEKVHFGVVHTGYLNALSGDPNLGLLAPATDHLVYNLLVCLKPGTPAGTYPLTLEEAELVDWETRESIPVERTSATLTVLEDVTAGRCETVDSMPPSGPEDVYPVLRVGRAGVEHGARQELPVVLRANAPIEGFTFSIEYGRELRLTDVRPRAPGGEDWDVFTYTINGPPPAPPFSAGMDFVTVFAEFGSPELFLEPDVDYALITLEFEAVEGVENGFVQVGFSESGQRDGDHVQNKIRVFGQLAGPRDVPRWESDWGGLFVGSNSNNEFLRGDANLDGRVTISDALMLRRFFFLGGIDQLPCESSGDTDDSGSHDIGDSIWILNHLFTSSLDESLIADPYPDPGLDPTIDTPCFDYAVTPPATTDALIRLGSIEAGPGEDVEIPIFISSDSPLDGYQLLVAYDPASLTPADGSLEFAGTIYAADPDFGSRGFAGVRSHPEAGLLTVGFVAHFSESTFDIPAGENVLVGKIPGRIPEDAPLGELRLHLVDDDPTDVTVKHLRTELTVEGAARFVSLVPRLEDGFLQIVGDLTFFTRGDSNSDDVVDIADPIFTLGFLFGGGRAPLCPDAADADDSGVLDLTDAIITLNVLFGAGPGSIAFPYFNRGRDPTPDDLGRCES